MANEASPPFLTSVKGSSQLVCCGGDSRYTIDSLSVHAKTLNCLCTFNNDLGQIGLVSNQLLGKIASKDRLRIDDRLRLRRLFQEYDATVLGSEYDKSWNGMTGTDIIRQVMVFIP